MEAMMEQLLGILSSSTSEMDRYRHIQAMLQELRSSPDIQARHMAALPGAYPQQMTAAPGAYPQQMAGGAPAGYPQQESPQMQAIRNAALAGDKIKAIKLYRELYGVDFKTAQAAIDAL